MAVEFEDFSIQVTEALEDSVEEFLYTSGELIKGQAAQISPVASGQLRGSWDYEVNLSGKEVKIGSPLENAVWNEFGKKVLCRIKIGQNRLSFIGECGKICL